MKNNQALSHTEELQILTEKAESLIKSMNDALDTASLCIEGKDFLDAREQLDLYDFLLDATETIYDKIESVGEKQKVAEGMFVA
jgi:hypothetical protein